MVGKAKKKTLEKLDDQITENCLKVRWYMFDIYSY